ncbi:hypothetical protein H3V11_04550 [Snodgrassella sp. W8158]|uniref:hypothetical protein n=1 Tax=Snodgrassella sp. W8158 TaxID=2751018 RepID=UPI0018DC0478|nr:hypothetical protein [Snodgrassella sp. W8158]MBI0181214.1 hypothetical protein [Snodgrassella sp. W8158]
MVSRNGASLPFLAIVAFELGGSVHVMIDSTRLPFIASPTSSSPLTAPCWLTRPGKALIHSPLCVRTVLRKNERAGMLIVCAGTV